MRLWEPRGREERPSSEMPAEGRMGVVGYQPVGGEGMPRRWGSDNGTTGRDQEEERRGECRDGREGGEG